MYNLGELCQSHGVHESLTYIIDQLWQHRAILGGFSTRANQMGPLRLHYVVHRYHHGVHFDPCKLLHHFADRRAHFHSHYVNLLGNGVVGTWMEERPLRAAVEAPTSARLDDEDDHFVLLSSVTQLLTTSVHLAISILGVRDQETREHLLVLSSGFRQNDIANNRTKFNPLQHS